MSLVAIVHVGETPPLGEGFRPSVVAHLHAAGLPRFLAYEVGKDGDLDRIPGAYAPDLERDPAYPVTDLILATRPDLSTVGQRLTTLDTKARANYGSGFRDKVFDSDVEWGSAGYGRHFEARSQLESHPFEGRLAVGFLDGASESTRRAITDNLDRIDAATVTFDSPAADR